MRKSKNKHARVGHLRENAKITRCGERWITHWVLSFLAATQGRTQDSQHLFDKKDSVAQKQQWHLECRKCSLSFTGKKFLLIRASRPDKQSFEENYPWKAWSLMKKVRGWLQGRPRSPASPLCNASFFPASMKIIQGHTLGPAGPYAASRCIWVVPCFSDCSSFSLINTKAIHL